MEIGLFRDLDLPPLRFVLKKPNIKQQNKTCTNKPVRHYATATTATFIFTNITCVSWHPQLRNGGFRAELLPTNPHALADSDSSYLIWIREKTLEFSMVLPAPYLYLAAFISIYYK